MATGLRNTCHAEPYAAVFVRRVAAAVVVAGGGQVVGGVSPIATKQTTRRTVNCGFVPRIDIAAHIERAIRSWRCCKRPDNDHAIRLEGDGAYFFILSNSAWTAGSTSISALGQGGVQLGDAGGGDFGSDESQPL